MKRLVFLTAVLGSIVLASFLLIRWGPGGVPVQAQESTSPPPAAAPSAPLSPGEAEQVWRDAEHLAAQGQHEAGADLYMRIVTDGPSSVMSLKAALRAGHCYKAGGLVDKAVAAYQAVEGIAASQTWPNENDKKTANIFRSSAVCNRAVILDEAGNQEGAAQLYGSLVREVMTRRGPLANITYARASDTIERAGNAAKCLERADKPAEALWYYDAIVAIAEAKGFEDDPRDAQTAYGIHNLGAQALCDKANACVRAGQPQEALNAIRRMRMEFADCPAAVEMGILEAQLTGGDVQRAELLSTRESEASDLLKQLTKRDGGQAPEAAEALRLLDNVITSYPGTAAVLRALESKGRLLKHQGRLDQAETAFLALMQQLGGEAAFRARLYQTARIQLAETRIKQLQARLRQHQTISGQDWDNLRALCLDIKTRGLRPLDRATAHFLLMETYGLQDQLDALLQQAGEFLNTYRSEENVRKLGPQVMWVHNFAGTALYRKAQFDKALEHFRWITHHYETTGTIPPNEGFMPLMYYRIWEVLRAAKAPADDIEQAANDLLVRFPDSKVALRLPPRPPPPAD